MDLLQKVAIIIIILLIIFLVLYLVFFVIFEMTVGTYEMHKKKKEDAFKTCGWKLDRDGFWQTECGDSFIFYYDEDIVNHTRFIYCPFCGKEIKVIK